MREHTVPASFVSALLRLAVSKGARLEHLCARSGLETAELKDPDARVPLSKYVRLMRAGQELCHDPALALHFGEEVDMEEVTIVGMVGRPAGRTLEEDLAEFNRYAPLALDCGEGWKRFELARIDGQLWMIDHRPNPNDFPEFTESFFARAVCGVRRRFGNAGFIRALHVTHPAPPYRAEYDRIFQVPTTFESERNALLISDDFWPKAKSGRPPRIVAEVLTAHADVLLQRLEQTDTTRGRVESVLTGMLPAGEGGMDAVASRLGLGRRTLLRKLKDEGVTFEKVVDELRQRLAHQHLGEGRSISETAYLLGFSDPAAFSRAFKRWTGTSPRNRTSGGETDREEGRGRRG